MKRVNFSELDTNTLVDTYCNSATSYGNAILNGDHKVANREHAMLNKICDVLRNRGKIAALFPLLASSTLAIRYCAAVDVLQNGSKEGAQTLEEIVAGPPSPLSLLADISFREWKAGRLSM